MLPFIIRGADQPGFFGGGFGLIGPELPAAPEHGRYLCLVPLFQEWRSRPDWCRSNGVPHLSDILQDAGLVADLQAGRCALLLDMSNEGFAFDPDTFDAIHAAIDAAGVPRRRAAWISQNRAAPAAYRARYGEGIAFVMSDAYVKAALQLFAGSAAAVMGRPPAQFAADMADPAAKRHSFLCLNSEPRAHRVLALAAFRQAGLFDAARISFFGLARSKSEPGAMIEGARAFMAAHPGFQDLQAEFDAVLHGDSINAAPIGGNDLAFSIDVADYLATWFSVVNETEFSDGRVIRITEKSIKAAALGHPVHIVGNPGSLALLRELGFHQAVAGAYDTVPDPVARFRLLMQEITADVDLATNHTTQWLDRVAAPCAANIQHAASGAALAEYGRLVDQPALATIEALF